jgi:hypothetical protein
MVRANPEVLPVATQTVDGTRTNDVQRGKLPFYQLNYARKL